jgi:hypothetical protein
MKWRCVEVGGSKIRGVIEISELGGAIPGVVQIPVDYVSVNHGLTGQKRRRATASKRSTTCTDHN